MNRQLLEYISFARKQKMNDDDIRANLVSAGWPAEQVDAAVKGGDHALLVPPPPPPPPGTVAPVSTGANLGLAGAGPQQPIAVVSQRTTRGLEYVIMFLALGVTAVSLGEVLHNLVDNGYGNTNGFDGAVSYATSALIVALPIFAILFLRLKKAEQKDSNLRHDSSRRHAVQLTLIVAFLWGLFRLVTFIYSLMNGGSAFSLFGDGTTTPWTSNLLHMLITVSIAGGIFAYYWIDEHKKGQD